MTFPITIKRKGDIDEEITNKIPNLLQTFKYTQVFGFWAIGE